MKEQLELGEALVLKGKWEEAEKYYVTMNSEYPNNPDILNNMGVIKESIGRLRESENYYLDALKCDPLHDNSLMNLAHLYSKTARWRQATECLEKLLSTGAVTIEYFNQLAVNYLNIAELEKARQALENSLALNAEQPVVKEMLQEVKKIKPPTSQNGSLTYRAAFCEINITPPVSEDQPLFLQGMAGNPRQANTVADPLMMQMMLLEDRNDTRLLFVTADLFGFDDRMVDDIRQAAGLWGIAPEGIILNASHTHYAPGTMSGMLPVMGYYYQDYVDQIKSLIIKNLTRLYHSLEPCRLYLSATDAQIGLNRRLEKDGQIIFGPNPEGPYDRLMPFLVLDMCDSDQSIILVNHGCHPTGLGNMAQISADFPGYLRNALVCRGFAHGVMFFQGAAGDIKEATEFEKKPFFAASHQDAQQNGERLATAIVNALEYPVQPVTGDFFCSKKIVQSPLKTPMPTERIQMLANDETANPLIREWANLFLASIKDNTFDRNISMELQWISIGEQLRFITLQGEPVTSLAQNIRSLVSNQEGTFLLGYTNGLKAYIPTDEMIDEGGYEVDFSHFVYPQPSGLARGMEDRITDTISHFRDCAEQTGRANGYGRYHLTKKPRKAFFVMSAGRCGTMTLAHILNTADNARVWHHPQPDPIHESLQAYWGKIDTKAAFWRARRSLIHETWAQGKIHGETDLLMTPFCEMLSQEIEEAKFLILVRHPADFVRSGMRRNYYGGHPWDFGRLRPLEASVDFEAWNGQDQFGKICWLWRETYKRARQIKATIGDDRVMVFRFEDLIKPTEELSNLFDFLELKGFDKQRTDTILSKKLNAQVSGEFAKPHKWSKTLSQRLWTECGQLAEQFGYTKMTDSSAQQGNAALVGRFSPTPEKLLILETPGTSTGGHLDHIVTALDGFYEVKYVKTTDTGQLPDLVAWADIVWLEWANQMAIYATNHIPQIKNKRVVCRLHGYEVFTDMPNKINWEHVQRLIFVAKHKMDIFNSNNKNIQTPQIVIRNGIDVEKFTIAENKKNTKKLVLLGHLNFRKGLPILLHFYQQLLKRDPSFYLYIRGEFQDPRLELAVRKMIHELGLKNKVEFVDWVEDLNAWLADKSHILSFSLEESFHYAIGNGMAAGLKPVIHAWNESREIWPNKYIFRDLDEFLQIVCEDEFNSKTYRGLVFERRLDKFRQLDEIKTLLVNLVNQPLAETSATRPMSIQSFQQVDSQASKITQQPALKKNIFILGLKRSGTTIFWKTFRRDRRFLCFDEPFAPRIREFVREKKDHDKQVYQEYIERPELVEKFWCPIQPLEETYSDFLNHHILYLNALIEESENVCIDFTRCHMKIAKLKNLFPDSLVIHLVRDPRAFVTSHLKPYGRWCSRSLPDQFFTYSGPFDFWSYETLSKIVGTSGFAHERLLRLWNVFTQRAEEQEPDLTIQFETFARNPEETVKLVYEKLNIDYLPLDFSDVHAPNPPFNLQCNKWTSGMERLGLTKKFLSVWE